MRYIQCITITTLCKILRHIITDYGTYHSGWPDLVLWRETKTKSTDSTKNKDDNDDGLIKVVEVKGPGDRLSGKQEIVLQLLQELGVPVCVCRVRAITMD